MKVWINHSHNIVWNDGSGRVSIWTHFLHDDVHHTSGWGRHAYRMGSWMILK